MTKHDEYEPTAKERRLIEAMSEPDNRNLNKTALCKVVGISRDAYYAMFKKPEFVAYHKKVQFEVVKGSIAKVLNATIEFATTDPRCHQDRKILLEMAGVYTEKIQQEHSGKSGGPITVRFVDPRAPD